jgi:hypothetical protein
MVDLFFPVFLLRGPIRKSGSWRSAAPVDYTVLSNHRGCPIPITKRCADIELSGVKTGEPIGRA